MSKILDWFLNSYPQFFVHELYLIILYPHFSLSFPPAPSPFFFFSLITTFTDCTAVWIIYNTDSSFQSEIIVKNLINAWDICLYTFLPGSFPCQFETCFTNSLLRASVTSAGLSEIWLPVEPGSSLARWLALAKEWALAGESARL